MRDARELDSTLRRSAPFIDPLGLHRVLRDAAAWKNLEWCEEKAERRNSSGQRVGPHHAFGDDTAALIARAALHLDRALQCFILNLEEHAGTPTSDVPDLVDPDHESAEQEALDTVIVSDIGNGHRGVSFHSAALGGIAAEWSSITVDELEATARRMLYLAGKMRAGAL